MIWTSLDTWIVVTGALSAVSAALLGCFLVLRRMSMMGDAISHAVLPGLAAAFLLTGSRGSVPMLIGAVVVGVLTALLTQWVHRAGRVEESAAMGVVFTVLFALGLVLIVRGAHAVDLDPDCVLYGVIETTPLRTVNMLGFEVPRAAVISAASLLLVLTVLGALYKEFKITTFDPALATALGIRADWMHYLLMALVAITTVTAFENVGSILVIAMLIVPAAAAQLLTERLGAMLTVSALIAVISVIAGHWSAVVVPGWFGFEGISTSTPGMIAVAAGAFLLAAILLAPRHGVVGKLWRQAELSLRIRHEGLLGLLYRLEEPGRAATRGTISDLSRAMHTTPMRVRRTLRRLSRRGLVRDAGDGLMRLTDSGRRAAAQLVRSHRLWETYLMRNLDVPADHVHGTAERLEHVTDPDLRERLAVKLQNPEHDPHGSPIPPP